MFRSRLTEEISILHDLKEKLNQKYALVKQVRGILSNLSQYGADEREKVVIVSQKIIPLNNFFNSDYELLKELFFLKISSLDELEKTLQLINIAHRFFNTSAEIPNLFNDAKKSLLMNPEKFEYKEFLNFLESNIPRWIEIIDKSLLALEKTFNSFQNIICSSLNIKALELSGPIDTDELIDEKNKK